MWRDQVGPGAHVASSVTHHTGPMIVDTGMILAPLIRPFLFPLMMLIAILILGLIGWSRITAWTHDRDETIRRVERLEVDLRDAREESRRLAEALEDAERQRVQREALQRDQDAVRERFRFQIDAIDTDAESIVDHVERLGFPDQDSSGILRETIRRMQANRQ